MPDPPPTQPPLQRPLSEAELERLERKATGSIGSWDVATDLYGEDVGKLIAEVRRLRAALGFYRSGWDEGQVARKALGET